jgi:hypothetical protein
VVTGYAVQGGVDEAGLGAFEERLGDLDVFIDGHLGRHVRPAGQLIGASAQDGPQRGVDPLQSPAGRQAPGDGAVDRRLVVDHAPHQFGEEGFVGRGQMLALDVAAEPVVQELAHHGFHAGAGRLHLVEGLDGREPRHRALLAMRRLAAHRAWP